MHDSWLQMQLSFLPRRLRDRTTTASPRWWMRGRRVGELDDRSRGGVRARRGTQTTADEHVRISNHHNWAWRAHPWRCWARNPTTAASPSSNHSSFMRWAGHSEELKPPQIYRAHPRPMLSLESMAWLTDSVGEELVHFFSADSPMFFSPEVPLHSRKCWGRWNRSGNYHLLELFRSLLFGFSWIFFSLWFNSVMTWTKEMTD